MKLGRWRLTFEFIPIIDTSDKWLYRWHYNFFIFTLALTDLGGKLIICNCRLMWEKMFWRP